MNKKTAVVTGANKGIGFEISRQLGRKGFHVIMTGRNEALLKAAAEKLSKEKLDVRTETLDVSSPESILKFKAFIEKEYGAIDVLINNAAIFVDRDPGASVLTADVENIQKTLETNVYGPLLLSQSLALNLAKKKGRIINLSSGMGQLKDMQGDYPAYRISKTALNALTRMLASELAKSNVAVFSMCPGWVKTDMGGPNAERTPEQGADTAVWLATEAPFSLTGGFYRDRKSIPW